MEPPIVAGEKASDRLMRAISYNRRLPGPKPTAIQVAMVLHAMADHTAIMAALVHRPEAKSPWPHATSMGRWLHDVADGLEGFCDP